MKRTIVPLVLLALVVVGFPSAFAQQPEAMGPPNVLYINRERIKPGKGADHTQESHRFTLALRKAKSQWGRIGMTPVAGNDNDVLYIWPFKSFADVEKMNRDLESWATGALKADFDAVAQGPEDLHTNVESMLAIYRPDLSYMAGVNIAEMRYFAIDTFQVRPGQDSQFAVGARMYMDTVKKAKIDAHYAIYQVVAGTETGIYLIFSPMKSMAEMDRWGADMKAFGDAMGAEGMKSFDKLSGEVFQSMSSRIYAFNPQMSYVSAEFAGRDKSTPAFWNPN